MPSGAPGSKGLRENTAAILRARGSARACDRGTGCRTKGLCAVSEDRDTEFWLGWGNREKQTHWRRVDKRLILRTRGPGGRRALQESRGGPDERSGGIGLPGLKAAERSRWGQRAWGGPAGEQAGCRPEPEHVPSKWEGHASSNNWP